MYIIFESKQDELGDQRRDSYLHRSPSIVRKVNFRRLRRAGHVGKTLGKRPLGIPRMRWQDKVNVDVTMIIVRIGGGWNRLMSSGGFGISGVKTKCSATSLLVTQTENRDVKKKEIY
jgi:hypothetical protein